MCVRDCCQSCGGFALAYTIMCVVLCLCGCVCDCGSERVHGNDLNYTVHMYDVRMKYHLIKSPLYAYRVCTAKYHATSVWQSLDSVWGCFFKRSVMISFGFSMRFRLADEQQEKFASVK